MNSKLLEEAFTRIKSTATSLGLELSTHKTDLIHWRTPREKVARSEHPIVVDGECIQPVPKAVKWLGFYFENNHGTWTHYANRLALAQAAFDRIKRLSSPGGRLTPYSARRMAKAIIIPTLLYGAEFLDPRATMRHKMEVQLNRVKWWITNCFYSTNTNVLSAEACIMPVDLYLEQIRDMAAIRWSTALPNNNIATALFPAGFLLHDSFRLPSNRRAAFSKAGGMKPKTCDSTSCTSVQRILPIDDVARRARLLFSKWPVPRKPNIWSPPDPNECEYYENTLKQVREHIHLKWKLLNYPEYYGYRPAFRTCWRFMTINKFAASRLHQMRAGKSYLKAQKDWRNPEASELCPRCENEPETFEHIIASCQALASARVGQPDEVFDISPESLIWAENKKGWDLMKCLISFISLNKLNFPSNMDVFPFTRASQIQS